MALKRSCVMYWPTCGVGGGFHDAALHLRRKSHGVLLMEPVVMSCGSFANCWEAHPVFLLGQVHTKLGGPRCEDRPAQKWGGYELDNERHHLLLWCLVYLCHKFKAVYSLKVL